MWQSELNFVLPVILIILQILAFSAGLLFIYAAAFTYETEENGLQSFLEDWWLRLAEENTSVSRATHFFRAVTTLTTHVFDRMLGAPLFSAQMVSVSICYAYAAANLSAFLLLSFFLPEFPATQITLWLGLLFMVVGLLPAIHPSLRWLTYIVTCCLLLLASVTVWLTKNIFSVERLRVVEEDARRWGLLSLDQGLEEIFAWEMPLHLLLGIIYGVLIISMVRFTVRTSSMASSPMRIVILLGSTAMLALLPVVVIGAITIPAFVLEPGTARTTAMAWLTPVVRDPVLFSVITQIGGPNVLWGLSTLLVAVVVIILVLHFMIWPVEKFLLTRAVYSAHRHQIIKNKKMLWTIGVGLITIACGGVPALINTAHALFGG